MMSVRGCRKTALFFLIALMTCGSRSFADAGGVDPKSRSIGIALTSEPPSLNSLTTQDQYGSFILGHVKEGLMRYGEDGELAGGVAERWEMKDREITFHLRRDARWHDGVPVTAGDFVTAWRAVVDPGSAAPNAHLLYPVRYAEAINKGQLPATKLGVESLDDHTLRVELEAPCAYFLALTAYATFLPVRADYLERFGSRYAAEAGFQAYNGAFKLDTWIHGARLVMRKNPAYWDHTHIRLEEIRIDHVTSDPLALMNLYSDGAIAMTDIGVDNLDLSLRRGLPLSQFEVANLFYLRFNFAAGRWTADPDLREAMRLAFNADEMVNKVIALPGFRPARSLFPTYIQSQGESLRAHFPPEVQVPDLIRARQKMQQFLQRNHLEAPPALHLLTSDTPGAAKQAEYLQSVFQSALNLSLKIDKQIFKQRLAKENQGDFDVSMTGWGPDYDDPMTFADLFASWNPNNRGSYRNPDYDRWLEVAKTTLDNQERLAAFGHLQSLLQKDVALLPLYENALIYVKDTRLKGVQRRRFGADPAFHFAWIEATP